jgi:hypothetical protein
MINVSDKSCTENQNTHFVFSNVFFENCAVFEIMWKIFEEPGMPQMTIYGACALHAGYLRLETHTQNVQYLLLFHYNNGCKNAPLRYVIYTLTVLLDTRKTWLKGSGVLRVQNVCI